MFKVQKAPKINSKQRELTKEYSLMLLLNFKLLDQVISFKTLHACMLVRTRTTLKLINILFSLDNDDHN